MADGRRKPLLIFFDSEAANGSVYYGDIIEIGAKCFPEVEKGSFQTLINTEQDLCSFVIEECGITRGDLSGKPFFPKALNTFLNWIDGVVASASYKSGVKYFPVLCAHGGYCFDFLILLGNMERFGLHHSLLGQHNLYFADSFQFCKEIKGQGSPLLQDVRLSLESLFLKFFPQEVYKDKHRAMGDVDAMVKIFTQTPLKNQMHKMTYTTTKERVTYYINQASSKLQQHILEDNLSRLDACSKNMAAKRLTREGLTYDRLQRIFEECCSFMDFFQFLKDKGVERKVAKFIALRFGGMGLQNQGALLKPTREKPTSHLGSLVIATNVCPSTSKIPLKASKKSVTFKDQVVPARFENPPRDPPSRTGQNGEDWDEEIAGFGGETSEFTLTFGKVIPLSLMIEDLCSPVSRTETAKSSNGQKKRVLDCQSNSEQMSNCSSNVYRKGKVLEKGKKGKGRDGVEIEGSSGKSSAKSKPESPMDLNETSMSKAPLPTNEKNANGTGNHDAQRIPKDDTLLNHEMTEESSQQCVWFTDEAISDAVTSMGIREIVTVFIGDVAICVPVNEALSKTSCDLASQKQSPSCCVAHEHDKKVHDISTHGERSVELKDFNTTTDATSVLNQAETTEPTGIVALETNNRLAADESSPKESCPNVCGTAEDGLGKRVVESVKVQNDDSEFRLSASTETGDIYNQFVYPVAFCETKSATTVAQSHTAVHQTRYSSDNQIEDSYSISGEMPHEAWKESYQGIGENSEENTQHELRLVSDAGHCGEILHQLYSSHGNPLRDTSHYPYPSTSHPPFPFVPGMLPMYMQPCLYPPAYNPSDFRGRQTHAPFFVPPTIQRAVFQASSGLYPRSGEIQATPAEQQRETYEDYANKESERNGNSSADCDDNGSCADERCSAMRYGNHSETSCFTGMRPAPVPSQAARNGLSNDFEELSCRSVATNREEGTPIQPLHGHEELRASVNGNSAILCNESVRSHNESTQDAIFPDTTSLHMDAGLGPPKPQRIRRPRNRKTLNGNKTQNNTDVHISVSQSLKAQGTSQGNRGSSWKDQDQAISKVFIASKESRVSSSGGYHVKLKSFGREFSQDKTITPVAVETERRGCGQAVKDLHEGERKTTKRDVKVGRRNTATLSSERAEKKNAVSQKQPLPPKD